MQEYSRQMDGLPNFPNQWVDDPREHQHRPTYEQLLYKAYEHQHRLQLQDDRRHRDDVQVQGSDMQAMNAALAGPNAWMYHHETGGMPHQLAAPIQQLMEAKRAEAERVRHIADQYYNERGPNDPETQRANEVALQAEAEAHGAVAVERALEHAPQGEALHSIAATVEIFEDEKKRSEISWHESQGRLGNNHESTVAARMAMLQAASAWQGALAAQAAPAERGFEAAEHPQAIANRANAAADAYGEESEELTRKADLAARKFGKNDPRAVEAQRAADEVKAKEKAALHEAATAQAVADGKPPPQTAAAKKKAAKKKAQSGSGCVVQ